MKICSIEGCEGKHYATDFCVIHYFRNYRNGTPYLSRRDYAECAVLDCEALGTLQGMCRTHYQKAKRENAPVVSKTRKTKTVVGYRMAHIRLTNTRGKAYEHWCVDGCGRTASEWSLSHDAETVLYSTVKNSMGKAYSLNAQDYDARCRPCHRLYDGAGREESA